MSNNVKFIDRAAPTFTVYDVSGVSKVVLSSTVKSTFTYGVDLNGVPLSIADGGTAASTAADASLSLGYKPMTGFLSSTGFTIGMSGSNFSITPSTSIDVYSGGTKFTISGAQTVAIDLADNDEHYIYFNTSGVLVRSLSPWDLTSDNIPVSIVYKSGAVYAVQKEYHSAYRNKMWHSEHHNTEGAMYSSGLTGTFTNTTLSVTQGVMYDEDLRHDTGGTLTNCAIWYRNSGGGSMTLEQNILTPYKAIAGALQYDNAGTITPVGVNQYVNSWVYVTNDKDYPIYVVIGQSSDTLANIRNEGTPTIPGLSTREWKLIYKVIYRNQAGTPTYIEQVDYREAKLGPGSSFTPASHTILTNRDAANQHPIAAIQTNNGGGILLGRQTAAAGAVEEVTVSTGLAMSANALSLSHLGLQSLTDPGADRIMFWDESDNALKWLTVSTGLNITTTNLTCTITQYTDSLARAAISCTATGLTYTSASGVLSLTAGYVIPSSTDWTDLTDSGLTTLHKHSSLTASDGSPDPALSVDAAGAVTIGSTLQAQQVTAYNTADNAEAVGLRLWNYDDPLTGEVGQAVSIHAWLRTTIDGGSNYTNENAGSIVFGKVSDYFNASGQADNDSYIGFLVCNAGTEVERMRLLNSGLLQIGAAPANALTTAPVLTANGIINTWGTGGGELHFYRDDDSIVDGNDIGMIKFTGADGGEQVGVQILAEAAGTWATGDTPGKIGIYTTPSGSATPIERLSVSSAGNITVNPGSVDADFTINWDSGTAFFSRGSDGWLGVGTTSPEGQLHLYSDDVANTTTWHGVYNQFTKATGASDAADSMYVCRNNLTLNMAGGVIGATRLNSNLFTQSAGDIGTGASAQSLQGLRCTLDLNAGKIYGTLAGAYITIDQESGHEVSSEIAGISLDMDLDGTNAGTSYLIKLAASSGLTYGIYQSGTPTNGNYFSAKVGIGELEPDTSFHITAAYTSNRGQFCIEGTSAYSYLTMYNGATYLGTLGVVNNEMIVSNYNAGSGGIVKIQSKASGGTTITCAVNGDVTVSDNLYLASTKAVGISGGGRIVFTDAATDYVSVMSANFGIGTTAPGALLDVYGSAALDGTSPIYIRISDAQNASGWTVGAKTAALEFYAADTSSPGAGIVGEIGMYISGVDTGNSRDMIFSTRDSSNVLKNAFSIAYNTGIVTFSTQAVFSVAGTTTAAGTLFSTGTQELTIKLGSGDCAGLTVDQYSSAVRFNGANVAWGDLAYYPAGSTSYGHFRFSLGSTTVDTVPDAKVGVGSLYSAGAVGIKILSPKGNLDIAGISANVQSYISCNSTTTTHSPTLAGFHNNGTTIGTYVATTNGFVLLDLTGIGVNNNGTPALTRGASIKIIQDGTPGTTYIPGRIEFYTGTNAAAQAVRVTIDNAGDVTLTGNVILASTKYVGLSGAGRIVFTDATPDRVTVTDANLVISATAAFISGTDGATDGDWQQIRSGNHWLFQRRESSSWVTKFEIED